jgi:hypothetical protein
MLFRDRTFPQVLRKIEKMLIVAVKQKGIAETPIGSVIEPIDSMINCTLSVLLSGVLKEKWLKKVAYQ